MENIIKKRRFKRKVKRIMLQLSFLLIAIGAIGIIASLTYSYSVNASKIPLKPETSHIDRAENIEPTTEVIVKDATVSPPKEEVLPEPAPTPVPTVIVEGKNQINGDGISSDSALVNDGKKTAFLTFDDGPSLTVTPLVLNVLKKYKVNGTFFLIGQSVDTNEQSKSLVKRIFKDGHAIGNHTYTHNLKKLYPNNIIDVPYFMTELEKNENSLKTVLGPNFDTKLIRIPGGIMTRRYYKDPNLDLLFSKFNENNIHTIDWNASILDSEGNKKNSIQLLDSLKATLGSQNKVVILMHDTYGKEETVKALPGIIEYLKAKGYEFKTLK